VRIDLTVFSTLMVAVVSYFLFFFVLGFRHVHAPTAKRFRKPLVIIVVPARNEEAVIDETLQLALAVPYLGDKRVLVIDDGSTDRTAKMADRLAADDYRLRVLRRLPGVAGRGKSEVLNNAYAELSSWISTSDGWLLGYKASGIVLCVIDADGHLSANALDAATAFFSSSRVGGVQIGVQIRDCMDSTLARLQDIELCGYSFMAQTARDRLGSVGLGGNGQFVRMSALDSLHATAGDPWKPGALTEDLDLGIRMIMAGWRLRMCSVAWVDQQGLPGLRPLLRQRTRWTQGAYQCWRHLPALAKSPKLWIATRFDSITRLLLTPLVILVTVALFLQVLNAAGIVTVTDNFVPWSGTGVGFRALALTLAWLPPLMSVVTYQRHSPHRLRWWEVPAFTVLVAAYAYMWALTTLRAWIRLARGRGNWVKTPRYVGGQPDAPQLTPDPAL
jgi:1,2-diacylglycerol 3-beta-glucosyltransferase